MSKLKLIDPKVVISKTRENVSIFPLLNVLLRLTQLNDKLLQYMMMNGDNYIILIFQQIF